MSNNTYINILMKIKANIDAHLKVLEPYDQDNRERNKVVECLEETNRYINWATLDSVGTNGIAWTDEDFAQIEDDLNSEFEE